MEEYSSQGFDAEKAYNSKGKEDNHWQGKITWKEYLEEVTEEDAKNNGFNYVQENLLYPLFELIIEKLKDTNIEELLEDHEKNKKELEEKFVKKVQELCAICQELENEELNKVITPLKNQVNDFAEYLEKYKVNNGKENEIAVEMEEGERNKLEKIVEVIKTLEEQVKTCHESLKAIIELPTN